jgi:N-acetylneuraminic acid mutarotase
MIRISTILALLFASASAVSAAELGTWRRLPDLPDPLGVAGAFAGVSGGALIVAGGANFPDKKPWEDGGKKVWHDEVYLLDRPDGRWKRIDNKLPHGPLAYGVSVSDHGSVLCVGGSDSERHWPDAFALSWNKNKLTTHPLPPLPRPIANACGTITASKFYIAGGQETPDSTAALDTLYVLDLSAEKLAWRELEACPGGGRILAVAAALGDDFYIFGGAELKRSDDGKAIRRYRSDAWRYRPGAGPGAGWRRRAELPHPVVAAPSPAPIDANGILLLGGDDGSQAALTPPQGHKGFSKSILCFDLSARAWREIDDAPLPAPRVTAPCVWWEEQWIIPSGERAPGVRSPEVWSLKPAPSPAAASAPPTRD